MKHRFSALLSALAAVPLLALTGCDPASPESDTLTVSPGLVPSVNTYEVHGVIDRMPDANGQMRINHEPIPTFVGREGEMVGMKAMIMPFPLAAGVSVEGLAVNDPVKFTFETTWAHEGSGYEILSIAPAPDYVPAETGEAHDHSDHAGHDHDDHSGHDHGTHDPHGHRHGDHVDHTGTVHDHDHE